MLTYLKRKLINLHMKRRLDNDWEEEKAFYYTARMGSVGEAAKLLHSYDVEIRERISNLQESFHDPLLLGDPFVPGDLKITREGKELLKIIENIFFAAGEIGLKKETTHEEKP